MSTLKPMTGPSIDAIPAHRPNAPSRWITAVSARLQTLPVRTRLELPGGIAVGAEHAAVVLRLLDARLMPLLALGQVGRLAQAYVEGQLQIDGTMRDLAEVAAALIPGDPTLLDDAAGPARWWSRLRRTSRSLAKHRPRRDREQIEFHYDVSNDFYALWLDPRRVYSCAYWPEGVSTLAAAQEAKLELLCRKLMLRPGERLLDVGAGWGALLLWAAERHGVRAHGITLSRQQHAHVRRLIAERGLANRVSIALCDYRDVPEQSDGGGPYDKIASIGMFEHVGRAQLLPYFRKLRRLLKPGGLLLNHGITAGGLHNEQLGAGIGDFVERYIFPGGELVHVSHVMAAMAEAGLETLDVENLRPHYARTLWAWSDALEAQLDTARGLTSERVVHAYRLYLAGSAMGFERGWMSLNQLLASRPTGAVESTLVRGAQSVYPFQRDHLYRS
ncbi:class I SAM-dependent methyltransferase [Methylibium sp.]|uniref:class I SAM-dependent methyltransferase n=1 Tax=Methylibium sp. TaxID=2067992 RepID=UPI003D142302